MDKKELTRYDASAGEHEEEVYEDIRKAVSGAHAKAARAVNAAMVEAYWLIGKRIAEEQGDRAEYGKHLMEYLSERLTAEFGRGFSPRNLWQMRKFYLAYPILQTLSAELSWSHYVKLLTVEDDAARAWYTHDAAERHLSVRELRRCIETKTYWRLLSSQGGSQDHVEGEDATEEAINAYLKDPYILDFLDVDSRHLHESDLEEALMDSLQEFLMELGNGFTFYGRQVHLESGGVDRWIDMVFYNYKLNCFVLIDLKTGRLDPRDVGQMDYYRRLFDDIMKPDGANPTVGLILCAEGDESVARYSALADGVGLLAAEYLTCLPSEDELARVIGRRQKIIEAAEDERDDS